MSTSSYAPRDGGVVATADDTIAGEVLALVEGAARSIVEARRDELVALADRETALGTQRLGAEAARMADQLRFYGRPAAEGGCPGVTIDEATDTTPRLVRVNRPLGPAVFGSSNFRSGSGCSALTLGRRSPPAVRLSRRRTPPTCRRVCVWRRSRATRSTRRGRRDVLSIIVGRQAGAELVAAPGIKAVGFTGSQAVGLMLWRIANERKGVIPVYAEMRTVNPVVLTPSGVEELQDVARGFVGSFTLGSGQFCTKPGVLFAPAGRGVADAVAVALQVAAPEATMLTKAIAGDVATGVDQMAGAGGTIVARVSGSGAGWSADAAVLSAPISALTPQSRLLEECFGPVALVVEYADDTELEAGIQSLQGSLAAAVFAAGNDYPDLARLITMIARQVGRVTVGNWPTGVAWTWAQQHGGPWPATSNPASTSVGAAALSRFVRPVTFQSVPDAALPPVERAATAADNPWRIPRRINGRMVAP